MRARDRVVRLLDLTRQPMLSSQIAEICGINHFTCVYLLWRLEREGRVTSVASREVPSRKIYRTVEVAGDPSIEAAEYHRDNAVRMWHDERTRADVAVETLLRSDELRDRPVLDWLNEQLQYARKQHDYSVGYGVQEKIGYWQGTMDFIALVRARLKERAR